MLKTSTSLKSALPFIEKRSIPNLFLRAMVLICGIAVINIWPIAHSIGARNIALVLGAILGLALLFQSFKSLTTARLLPLYCLLGLIGWVLLLYLIQPVAPVVQWKEITSTWLRVGLALLLGTGVGLVISESKILRAWALWGFLPLLAVQVVAYLHQSYLLSNLTTPFTPGIFISKAGGTYFLFWPYLFLCAYGDFLFNSAINDTKQSNVVLKTGACLLMFAVCFLAFYSLASLNGILIASICATVLIGRITVKIISRGRRLVMGALIVASFLIIGGFSIHTYSKQDGNKFNNLLQDIRIGVQIDRYTNWRNDTSAWVPDIPGSHPVNQSTYFRVASLINGARLISEHPLGTGFTYLPYGYYMSRIYPGSVADHTHSGWIDFALGVGIPGLLLCWFAIAWAIRMAIKIQGQQKQYDASPNFWSYFVAWGLGGITLLWVVLEVSEKEYIEHLMFMIAFLAAGNTALPTSKEKTVL